MSFLIIKYLSIDPILFDPLNQKLSGECLTIKHPVVPNDRIEVPYPLYPALEEAGLEAHECNLELSDLGHLLSLFLRDDAALEVVDTLYDAFNLLSTHISKGLLRGYSQGTDTNVYKPRAILGDEVFVVHLVGIRQSCHNDRK
jgi:hypothetical protein